MKNKFFQTNPEKAASKVTIDSFMMGSLFFVFTLIWTLNPKKFNAVIIFQLISAIPLLFVSALSYAKVGYKKEVKYWETFGWYTNTIGNAFVINVVGLLVAREYLYIGLYYFLLFAVLMIIYSTINIKMHPEEVREKIFKFAFLAVIVFMFGILPMLINNH